MLSHAVAPRIISICMDVKSEIAAVIGTRPVMITGGSTPMEGLPGDRICGDIDPEIPIILIKKMGWGAETINDVLSKECGLCGLTGENVTLEAVFDDNKRAYRLACDIMTHRFVIACGAAIAAMGGLDAVIFSGRYADAGSCLERILGERIKRGCPGLKREVAFLYEGRLLEEIIAERVICRLVGPVTTRSATPPIPLLPAGH
jgi:acetate kinase